MKRLSPKVHGIADYLLVLLLAIAPATLGFKERETNFTYEVALVYLVLTLVTDFDTGLFKILPFQIHGAIEFSASLALVLIAFILRSSSHMAFYFYMGFSSILFCMSLVSNYSTVAEQTVG